MRLAGPEGKTIQTDSSGKFSVEVKAGDYSMGASAPDYFASSKSFSLQATKTESVEVTLEKGGDSSLVEVKEKEIEIAERVFFETGKAKIQINSHGVLDQVASALKANPQIKRVEIQGHTDDVGSKENNMTLSQNRAESVMDYLVGKGVNPSRLKAKGFGPTKPVVPNISDRNRKLNRRVEFKITRR